MEQPSAFRLVHSGSLAAALAALLAASSTQAANIYWDGTGSSWGAAASWSTASGAATPDSTLVPGTADIAIFSISTLTNTAQTVNLNAAQRVLGLSFLGTNTATTLLQGGGTNQTLNPWLKIGTGTLTLTGSNTITRAVTVVAGVLNIQNNNGAAPWPSLSSDETRARQAMSGIRPQTKSAPWCRTGKPRGR